MEVFGLMAFIFAISQFGNADKIKKLEQKIKKFERGDKGGSIMSKMLNEVVGKSCTIMYENGTQKQIKEVLEFDAEWVKYTFEVKDKLVTKFERLDNGVPARFISSIGGVIKQNYGF